MNTYTTLMLFVTNVICLFIGYMLGDEARHEAQEVADESDWLRHSQQAMWAARRTR